MNIIKNIVAKLRRKPAGTTDAEKVRLLRMGLVALISTCKAAMDDCNMNLPKFVTGFNVEEELRGYRELLKNTGPTK